MPAFEPRPVDPAAAAHLASELGVHPVTAQVLLGRGLETPAAARAFLRADVSGLHDPFLLRDLDAAVARIEAAVAAGTRIAIYGDYDVDGVCSTVVLTHVLRALGAEVVPFIPHRVRDGYGLSGDALDRLHDEGCGLVITVDNGITRATEIERAQAKGLQVVVTDHHEPAAVLPPCPVVDPKRHDATYPFPGLAGCGVAFKVACALADRRGPGFAPTFQAMLPHLLAVVAIGTVADVVPLLDENRIFVRGGLKALAGTKHAGLRALLQVSRCDGRELRSTDVGFRIGPRINAAGRLGSAHLALDLLLCDEPETAVELARELDAGNRERQRIERRQAEEAYAQAESQVAAADAPAIVLAQEEWHPGVIGIVAARVAERYGRPAALIALDGDEGKGSARSHGAVRLHEALADCAPLLRTHGGHALAAGFTIEPGRVDAFRSSFVEAIRRQQGGAPGPRTVDAELPLDAIHRSLAGEIGRLQPFGCANDEPIFCARQVHTAGRVRRVGSNQEHLVFYAAGERRSWRAVAFKQAAAAELLEGTYDLAYCLRPREDAEGLELHVREIRASE